MHFALTQEQQELVSIVRGLIERRAGSMDLRTAYSRDSAGKPGYDTILWKALCEQIGVAALAIPEKFGGAGFSYLETHLVLEELGTSLTPSPLLGSGILATQALLLSDSPAAADLLSELATGTVGALCWADGSGHWRTDGSDLIATPEGDSWRLTGIATLVLDAVHADVLLAIASTPSGVGLFHVSPAAPGVDIRTTPGLDQTLSLAEVAFDATAPVVLESGFEAQLPRLRAIAATAVSALQTGGAQRALDLTVAYLKERVQFGRPLGSFQALKHRCADLMVLTETARSMSWAAGWSAAYDHATLEHRAALAKSWCGDAFNTVAGEMIQLHGGIAITWEHDAHLYFKRAHALEQLFGRGAEHRQGLIRVP